MNGKRLFAAATLLSAAVLGLVIGASTDQRAKALTLFSGPACSEPSQMLSCFNQLIAQINAATGSATISNAGRNLIDNAAMAISQRGTSAATCANNGTAMASANYAADPGLAWSMWRLALANSRPLRRPRRRLLALQHQASWCAIQVR